jgi:hypothetical protein
VVAQLEASQERLSSVSKNYVLGFEVFTTSSQKSVVRHFFEHCIGYINIIIMPYIFDSET